MAANRTGCAPSQGVAADTRRQWFWLAAAEQKLPLKAEYWQPYEPELQYHLSASYNAMCMEGRTQGLVLDLSFFTTPPSPYQVWRARPEEVLNEREFDAYRSSNNMCVAGFPSNLWPSLPSMLPPVARHGRVVAGFYQIRPDQIAPLDQLMDYLREPSSGPNPLDEPPKRRVVLLVEIERPNFMFGSVDRFRKKKPVAAAPAAGQAPPGENDQVPAGEAVFQWWWGDPNTGWGHWKNYHPHVSARLEQELATNPLFASGEGVVSIDDVRYNLQRISQDRPFNYLDDNVHGNFREVFLPENVVTVQNPLYDEQTRLTNNCFVQFQKGNPKRRRPVRRIRRGEAAGIEMPDGDPCGICFSDTGVLTGCVAGHIMCHTCVRFAIRTLVGDVTQTDRLMCGCFTPNDTDALQTLAKLADDTTQDMIASPPTGGNEKTEFDTEIASVRRAFQLQRDIPAGVYGRKLSEWQEGVARRACEHLYYACSFPQCPMSNWILKTDFDLERRATNQCTWTCGAGHQNSVLPTEEDIDEVNRNLLMHPEYYVGRCGCDSLSLRRFRICAECVTGGLLTFAVHEDGCKQWPGGRHGHHHCFCFHCTAVWGTRCDHSTKCRDPGVQQVRRINERGQERLEIGFVDAKAYISWIRNGRNCPQTQFPSGTLRGEVRQARLGMEDRTVLKRAMEEGTQ